MKIEARDLRIGNYTYNEKSEIYIVSWINKNIEPQLEPIPLTEEWLLRFDIFKENGYPYNFLSGRIKIRNGIFFFKYYNMEVELKSVHQIQNLYHSLTGTELILK